eukprot:gene26431-biopygen16440
MSRGGCSRPESSCRPASVETHSGIMLMMTQLRPFPSASTTLIYPIRTCSLYFIQFLMNSCHEEGVNRSCRS